MVADEPSAIAKWNAEKAAMQSLGYKVVYDPTFEITQTDFNQNVIAMKNAGVKILFLEQMPENYAAAVVKALNQQDFHPVLVLGGSTYSEELVPNAGGASAIDGSYLEQNTSLYLGEDKPAIPAITTFQTWIQKASPGFKADLYTLYGWLSAELFTQALKAAGPHPSRGSILQQLRKITSFSGGNLVGTANPAAKIPTNCYIIAQIVNGKYQRLDDPPVTGSDPRLPLRPAVLLRQVLTGSRLIAVRAAPPGRGRGSEGAAGAGELLPSSAEGPRGSGTSRRLRRRRPWAAPASSAGTCGWPPGSCG